VDFSSYDINLFNPHEMSEKKKSPPSLTLDELSQEMKNKELDQKQRRKLEIEYHRRWSLSAACLIFALLGVGLGTVTNRRASRGGGFVICLALLVSYWICYVSAESFARNGWLPASIGLWLVNAVFFAFAVHSLKKSWA
jgi:lipopolysaccharide export system permease protein